MFGSRARFFNKGGVGARRCRFVLLAGPERRKIRFRQRRKADYARRNGKDQFCPVFLVVIACEERANDWNVTDNEELVFGLAFVGCYEPTDYAGFAILKGKNRVQVTGSDGDDRRVPVAHFILGENGTDLKTQLYIDLVVELNGRLGAQFDTDIDVLDVDVDPADRPIGRSRGDRYARADVEF